MLLIRYMARFQCFMTMFYEKDSFLKDLRDKGKVRYGSIVAITSGSRAGFLKRGLITAVLQDCGT